MLIQIIYNSSGLMLPIKGHDPQKVFLIFIKGRDYPKKSSNHNTNYKSDSAYQTALLIGFKAHIYKNGEFIIFDGRMRAYWFFFSLFPMMTISKQGL